MRATGQVTNSDASAGVVGLRLWLYAVETGLFDCAVVVVNTLCGLYNEIMVKMVQIMVCHS